MRIYILLLFILFSRATQAELTVPGGIEVKDFPSLAKSIFKLNGNIPVETAPPEGNVCRLMIRVWIYGVSWTDDNQLLGGQLLYDSAGNEIGKTIAHIIPERLFRKEPDSRIMVELFGYLPVWSLQQSSVVEHELELLLKQEKKQFIASDFKNHFTQFNYKDFYTSGDFSSKIYYESRVKRMKPGGRIILIFFKNELAAVVYSRELKVAWYESLAESKPYKIYYMKKMNDQEKRQLADLYFNKVSQR